jgi:hypothetical protein
MLWAGIRWAPTAWRFKPFGEAGHRLLRRVVAGEPREAGQEALQLPRRRG